MLYKYWTPLVLGWKVVHETGEKKEVEKEKDDVEEKQKAVKNEDEQADGFL